jgi:hypothetical protein
LGGQNSHNPARALLPMELRKILWDFRVVCLNAPKYEEGFLQDRTRRTARH